MLIPAVTPFAHDGSPALDLLQANVRRWSQSPISGYLVLGSNGESRALSDSESLAVIRAAAEANVDKTIMVGVGRESLYQTLRFLEQVSALGVNLDYVSVLTPSFFANAMTDGALIDFYQSVADVSEWPVLLYCAPRYANTVIISPRAVAELADHPNIAGIKDTSDSLMAAYIGATRGRQDFAVLAGSVGNLKECLSLGGAGGVCSMANFLPASCARIVELYEAGESTAAFALVGELQQLARHTSGPFGVAGVKACMNLLGYAGTTPRPPVQPVPQRELLGISAELCAWRGLTWEPAF